MTDWTPDFPGQRPPFEPDNEAAVKHGAFSERRVGPLTEQIAARLLGDDAVPDYLRDPTFGPAVRAWARSEAVVTLLWRWLDSVDTAKHNKAAVATLTALHKAESAAAAHRRALGLDPSSAARLMRDMAASRYLQGRAGDGAARLAAQGAELAARDMAALDAATETETGGDSDD